MTDHLDTYRSVCLRVCEQVLQTLDEDYYRDAVALIRQCRQKGGRLHITGIGKPAHLATYMASLFSSSAGVSAVPAASLFSSAVPDSGDPVSVASSPVFSS